MVWDRLSYLLEVENQLGDKSTFNDKILRDLVEASNKIYLNFKRKGSISENEMKYFVHDYKNASNLGQLYFFPKIQKRFSNNPGQPVISNCGTPTEKASEFLVVRISKVQGISQRKLKE